MDRANFYSKCNWSEQSERVFIYLALLLCLPLIFDSYNGKTPKPFTHLDVRLNWKKNRQVKYAKSNVIHHRTEQASEFILQAFAIGLMVFLCVNSVNTTGSNLTTAFCAFIVFNSFCLCSVAVMRSATTPFCLAKGIFTIMDVDGGSSNNTQYIAERKRRRKNCIV